MKDPALYELLQMIPVEPGNFMMGTPEHEPERGRDEKQRVVQLTRAFELGRYPVTNLVWSLVTNEPLEGEPLLPKVEVNWLQAVEFCQTLNKLLGLPQTITENKCDFTKEGFRLPTEAEWEYACRAGSTESRYGPLDDIAWHSENCGDKLHPVSERLPNAWGFYDTLGNVWEFCWDVYEKHPTQFVDPSGSNQGSLRVTRGGSWFLSARYARASHRGGYKSDIRADHLGFRLARTLPKR